MMDPILSATDLFLQEHKRRSQQRWPWRNGRWHRDADLSKLSGRKR